MPEMLKNPISEIYKRWNKAIEPVVGKGNFSMDRSQTLASGKKAYARLYMLGNVLTEGDLEGDECATVPTVQIECFAAGTNPIAKVYQIDEKSHQSMIGMGFRRTYGPELMGNVDDSIKRLVSRYTRIYTGQLLGE